MVPGRTLLKVLQGFESVISKLNALVGGSQTRLGVSFTPVVELTGTCDQLHGSGFPRMGREQMYSGVTGEPMDGPSFIGCVFYQRLRHMVVLVGLFYQKKRVPHSDKIHARSLGPVNQMVHVESCKTVQDSTTDNPRKAVHGKGGCALEKWNVSLCLCTFSFVAEAQHGIV